MTSGSPDYVGDSCWHTIQHFTRRTMFETIVLAFDPFECVQPCAQCGDSRYYRRIVVVTVQQHADTPHALALLRARRERPRSRRAAEQRDELAARSHSITSSARPSSNAGTARPIAFAVPTLITSSNLVGCITGRSAGLVPIRILPV